MLITGASRGLGLVCCQAFKDDYEVIAFTRKELDFVLYGDGINVTNFAIPPVQFSDHLPLVCDFEIDRTSKVAA